jgi:uncharacterized membrane protein
MDTTPIEIKVEREQRDTPNAPAELIILSVILAFLTAGLAWYGLKVVYTYNSFDDNTKIVGGDAYNYIIIGLRGCAWLLTAVISAIFSALFGLMAYLRYLANARSNHSALSYDTPIPTE